MPRLVKSDHKATEIFLYNKCVHKGKNAKYPPSISFLMHALVSFLKNVQIVVFVEPRQMRSSASSLYDSFPLLMNGNARLHCQTNPHPPLTMYSKTLYTDNLCQLYMQFLERKRSITLLVRQTSSPSPPPPNSVFKNFLHRQLIQIIYGVSRWSTGNRERATSTRGHRGRGFESRYRSYS